MKHYKNMLGAALALAGIAALWWACDFQKVSPMEPQSTKVSDIVSRFGQVETLSNIPIAEIVLKLATCLTQAEAEQAIKLLLEKTGIGTQANPNPNAGKYAAFFLSDADIENLAAWHLSFVTGGSTVIIGNKELQVHPLTIKESFEAFEEAVDDYLDDEFKLDEDDLEDILENLQKDAKKALRKPEEPDNALLAALIADGATIPATAPLFEKRTIRSPAQHFLLVLWMIIEYGEVKSNSGAKKERELCILRCLSPFTLEVFFSIFEPDSRKKEERLRQAARDFDECLESCFHDQGRGK